MDALRLANNTGVLINVAYGGTSTRAASSAIWKGTSILIGTPGRMADFLDKRVFLLKDCEFFFLDEADRMLDMGFRWVLIFNHFEYHTRSLDSKRLKSFSNIDCYLLIKYQRSTE